jgi:hypothetical protein
MVESDPADPEAQAMRALGRRVARLRGGTAAACTLAGIACGVLGYFWLRWLQFALLGLHYPAISGIASVVPCLWASGKVADAVSRRTLRVRGDAWIAAAVSRYGVARQRLVDFLSVWR